MDGQRHREYYGFSMNSRAARFGEKVCSAPISYRGKIRPDGDLQAAHYEGCVALVSHDRFVVVSGQAGFGLETLIAAMVLRCLEGPLSKISFCELPFRIVQHSRHSAQRQYDRPQGGRTFSRTHSEAVRG